MVDSDLHIVERLRNQLPVLTDAQRQGLEANIKAEGRVINPIRYWHDGTRNVIVDGMNRWEIVQGTDIPYKTEPMVFANYEEAELWILEHALNQRNLTEYDERRLRGELYNRKKGKQQGNVAKQMAEEHGVSERSVRRDGERVADMARLTPAALHVAQRASDREVKILAGMSEGDQNILARQVRVGTTTLSDALKSKAPPPPAGPPPLKSYEPAGWLRVWNTQIANSVRLVDKIAEALEQVDGDPHRAVQSLLNAATEEMTDWLQMEK
jgi:hypothetical protein